MIPLRFSTELIYQIDVAGDRPRLARVLSQIPIVLTLKSPEDGASLMEHWHRLDQQGFAPADAYDRSFQDLRVRYSRLLSDGLLTVSEFHLLQSEWVAGEKLLTEAKQLATKRQDATLELKVENLLGHIDSQQGKFDEAMQHFAVAYELAKALHDESNEAAVLNNMGTVHYHRGELDTAVAKFGDGLAIAQRIKNPQIQAKSLLGLATAAVDQGRYEDSMRHFDEQIAIYTQLGDRRSLNFVDNNMGVALYAQGRKEEALACFERRIRVANELGDMPSVATSMGNMAMLLGTLGQSDRALEIHKQRLAISLEYEDQIGVSTAYGNMGNIYHDTGRYQEALECQAKHEEMSRTMGDAVGLGYAIGNQGTVYADMGQYDKAIEYLRKALEVHQSAGFHYGTTYWLNGIAVCLIEIASSPEPPAVLEQFDISRSADWKAHAHAKARRYAKECYDVSERLGKVETMMDARIILARIDAAEGNTPLAVSTFSAIYAETDSVEERAEASCWRWKFTNVDDHRREAQAALEVMFAEHPRVDVKRRVAEVSVNGRG